MSPVRDDSGACCCAHCRAGSGGSTQREDPEPILLGGTACAVGRTEFGAFERRDFGCATAVRSLDRTFVSPYLHATDSDATFSRATFGRTPVDVAADHGAPDDQSVTSFAVNRPGTVATTIRALEWGSDLADDAKTGDTVAVERHAAVGPIRRWLGAANARAG